MMRYLKSEQLNGERDQGEDEEVDEQYVLNYTSLATRHFFEGLGGVEQMRRTRSGVIYCMSISPDAETVREVVFTPIPGS